MAMLNYEDSISILWLLASDFSEYLVNLFSVSGMEAMAMAHEKFDDTHYLLV